MSPKAIPEIPVYVDMKEDADGWQKIQLFKDPKGEDRLTKPITVHPPGAIITFKPVFNTVDWTFWNLTIHPLGEPTAAVDLDWYVTEKEAVLRDLKPKKHERTFSYTLALLHKDGTKYYLDPRLVNRGGGGE